MAALFWFLAFLAIYGSPPDVVRVGMLTIWLGATVWGLSTWQVGMFKRHCRKRQETAK